MAVLNLVNDDDGPKYDSVRVRPSSSRVEPARLTTLDQVSLPEYSVRSASCNLIPLYTYCRKHTVVFLFLF
jgi:hypothetical protein